MTNTINTGHEVARTPTRLTTRGKLALGAVALGVGSTAALGVDLFYTHHEKVVHSEQAGEDQLKNIHELLDGKAVIPSGVTLRTSPDLINGDSSVHDPDNIDHQHTIGKGKELVVTYPGFTQGKNGDTFLVMKRPGESSTGTTLDYVDLSELERQGVGVDFENIQTPSGGPLQLADVNNGNLPMLTGITYAGHGTLANSLTNMAMGDAMVPVEVPVEQTAR